MTTIAFEEKFRRSRAATWDSLQKLHRDFKQLAQTIPWLLLVILATFCRADTSPQSPPPASRSAPLPRENVRLVPGVAAPSEQGLGGIQTAEKLTVEKPQEGRMYWGDVHFFGDWHIQQNVATRGCRLLGPDEKVVVAGSFDECLHRLIEIRRDRKLAPMQGEAVVLVHGLIRSFSRMLAAREHLHKAGYQHVFIFDYASTEVDISTAAESLHRAVQSLEGIEKVHLVAHSMGGIVVREFLAKHPEPRVGRLVMLGTPNQGAELTDRFGNNLVFRFVFGPAAEQLASPATDVSKSGVANHAAASTTSFLAELPIPDCEFAVIAGCRGNSNGYNPLIPGDDDGIVGLSSTRLVGARDSLVVQCKHSRLTRDPVVLDYVARFLKEGRLRKEGPLEPILINAISAGDLNPQPRGKISNQSGRAKSSPKK